MPVERRGHAVEMLSKRGGVPLGENSRYGTVGILGIS